MKEVKSPLWAKLMAFGGAATMIVAIGLITAIMIVVRY